MLRFKDPRFVIGMLLIIVGIVAGIFIVDSANKGISTYVLTEDAAAGQELHEDQLKLVTVQVPKGRYVSEGKLKSGTYLVRSVGRGELLPISAISEHAPSSQVLVVPLAQPLPKFARVGDAVDLYFGDRNAGTAKLIAAHAMIVSPGVHGQFDNSTKVELAIDQGSLSAVVSALGTNGSIVAVLAQH